MFINRIIPKNYTKHRVESAIGILKGFSQGFANGDLYENDIIDIVDEILKANNLTVPEIMAEIGLGCEDYLKRYRFGMNVFECSLNNCTEWRNIRSIYGVCCTFNFNPNDLSQSVVSNDWGKHSGVSIILDGKMVTKSGFNTFVHNVAEYLTKSTSIISLLPGYDNFIRVRPQFNIPSQHFLSLPFESRRCFLPQDRNLTLFQQSRCQNMEFGMAIRNECGCHPYFLPQFDNAENTTENCTIQDIRCFKYDSAFWNHISSDCFPSCHDLFYRLTTSQTMLQSHATVMTLYKNITQSNASHIFSAHIFYGVHNVKVLKWILVITWLDLISNLGGILNLTLGISVISVFEVIYYCIYKPIQFIRKHDIVV
ncbi:sodium channel protein Nach-like [Contarinia nasturtii]|uniref:sodium channel protein Nach-like n=1 Tax=Contarinia nasturtii TaxID=265458 RepID=UPI0012D3C2E5|nr:sodium channel protein Nach-like [Contarinia nasturtii]